MMEAYQREGQVSKIAHNVQSEKQVINDINNRESSRPERKGRKSVNAPESEGYCLESQDLHLSHHP